MGVHLLERKGHVSHPLLSLFLYEATICVAASVFLFNNDYDK